MLKNQNEMKIKYLLLIIITFFLTECSSTKYKVLEIKNPPYHANKVFREFEDLNSPKFAHIIEKYQLDTVFHGETREFKRILLLRNWIKSVIKIDVDQDFYPGEGYVENILDEALKGQGYHCGHFMRVQNAIMNAYGYQTRNLGVGPGKKGIPDEHHGVNEVWSNTYNKWFVCDAKYNQHFEKNRIPLSALEIRDEFIKNEGADIVKVKGIDRTPVDKDPETGITKNQSVHVYHWVSYLANCNMFTIWPDYKELFIMYDDEYFKNNTWIRGDKPHWLYNSPEFLIKVEDRNAIEWTPNTIKSEVSLNKNKATINLISDTPNFKEYQLFDFNRNTWNKIETPFYLNLKEEKYDLLFRAINLAGVIGPVHRIVISKDK